MVKGFARLDEQGRIKLNTGAQAVAIGTGPQRRIKTKHLRSQFGKAQTAVSAGVLFRKDQLIACNHIDDDHPFTPTQRRLYRIAQPGLEIRFRFRRNDQPVDHQLNIMFFVFGQFETLLKFGCHPVDPGPNKAIRPGLGQHILKSTLTTFGHRGQQLKAGSGREAGHLLDNLLGTLLFDLAPAVVAMRCADPGKEDPQIVVHLGNRADRTARIFANLLLLNGNGRAQTADEIDLGLFHLPQKLAGIGRETLHVTPLPLGIERIKGQRRFTTAAHPAKNNHLVTGNLQVNAFEVVFLSPFDHNFII